MRHLWSRAGLFAFGMLTAVLVVVVLMAAGVLPLKVKTQVLMQQVASSNSATMTRTAAETSLSPADIYEENSTGVVEVLASFTASSNPMYGMGSATAQALGSGFVVSSDGTILTNAHVVTDSGNRAVSVKVVFKLQKGGETETREVAATIVGSDETSDVAVLKVDPAKAPRLMPLRLGDSAGVEVGEAVVAIGNPLGYDFSVTSGIVSATNRNLESPNGSVIADGIQTDAAINEGNSGGPLIDSSGKVIGINEQIASQSGGNQGLGFAVPIDTARDVLQQIEAKGSVSYGYLGVQGQTLTSDVARALGIRASDGVLVAAVDPGSPAADAGLRGGSAQLMLQGQMYVTGGDVITALDGVRVASVEDFLAALNKRQAGDSVTLTVLRSGKTTELTTRLGQRSSS